MKLNFVNFIRISILLATILVIFLCSLHYRKIHGPQKHNFSLRNLRDIQDERHISSLPGHIINVSASKTDFWKYLEKVDGLSNQDVVMMVTSTATNGGYFLRDRIVASARTWMRYFSNVVVIIEDTFEIRFAMRHCPMVDHNNLYTTFECPNEPIFLLSRTCTNEYYGAAGPCCKVDDAINYLVNIRTDLFQHLKFMLHCDDDMYWRPDQVMRWLAAVENSGANEYPLIGNSVYGNVVNSTGNSVGVWHIKNCKEIQGNGWYQPVVMNRKLLERMAVAVSHYGIRDTCSKFDVTHDVGLGVFAWLFEPLHIRLPNTNINNNHQGVDVFQPTDMAMHCVKRSDSEHCDGKPDNGWHPAERYRQNVVIGCGDVNHPAVHGHNSKLRANMYDAWHYYHAHGEDIALNIAGINEFIESFVIVNDIESTSRQGSNNAAAVNKLAQIKHILHESYRVENSTISAIAAARERGSYSNEEVVVYLVDGTSYKLRQDDRISIRVIPRIVPLYGYHNTEHSKKNDIVRNWKPFSLQDCSPPGTIG